MKLDTRAPGQPYKIFLSALGAELCNFENQFVPNRTEASTAENARSVRITSRKARLRAVGFSDWSNRRWEWVWSGVGVCETALDCLLPGLECECKSLNVWKVRFDVYVLPGKLG